jgi:CHRD domain
MSKRLLAVLVVPVLAALVAGSTIAGAKSNDSLRATLSGKKELMGGKGKGSFSARLHARRVCYTLRTSGIGKAIAAHIHKGTAKQNGQILVDLKFTGVRRQSRCVPAAAAVVRAIRRSPGSYYVNVHTQKFPAGTMRGQLHG